MARPETEIAASAVPGGRERLDFRRPNPHLELTHPPPA